MSSELYTKLNVAFSESDTTLKRYHDISTVFISMRFIDKEDLPNDALLLMQNKVVELLKKEDFASIDRNGDMINFLNGFCLQMIRERLK